MLEVECRRLQSLCDSSAEVDATMKQELSHHRGKDRFNRHIALTVPVNGSTGLLNAGSLEGEWEKNQIMEQVNYYTTVAE